MLNQSQLTEIREHLSKSQNPVFFFDNDADGLCSFLLLRRFLGRGKGVAVKSFPDLNESYFRKVEELNADYIFVLDKPRISADFIKKAKERNIPFVWIDHHEVQDSNQIPGFINYYNPVFNSGKEHGAEPVTYLCYQLSGKQEDLWIAVIGCISDIFVPDFFEKFCENYPDLGSSSRNAYEILYTSQIGKISKILNFGLKDRTTNVVRMLKFLVNVKSPYEILNESRENFLLHRRFRQVSSKFDKLLEKAKMAGRKSGRLLFFQYGGDLSMSADLANELSYEFPEKIIVIAYIKNVKANISIRGKNVLPMTLKAVDGLEGATGGGHEDATGAKILIEDLPRFKQSLEDYIRHGE